VDGSHVRYRSAVCADILTQHTSDERWLVSLVNQRTNTSDSAAQSLAIERVEVKDLFGIYTYDLKLDSDGLNTHPNLMILYGDNGSGKTTILKLIFNLLSPEPRAGHRSYLARTPFRAFRITLSDGTVIAAVRSAENLHGEYTYKVFNGNELILSHKFTPNEEGGVRRSELEDSASYRSVLDFLRTLGLKFHYLGDDRKVATDYDAKHFRASRRTARPQMERLLRQDLDPEEVLRMYLAEDEEEADTTLRSAIARAEESIRREAFARSSRGSESANSVYTLLVERLINSTERDGAEVTSNLQGIHEKLTNLQIRNESFEQLGLSPPLDVNRIQHLIGAAPQERRILIAEILEPYVDGITARLDELQALQDTIRTFLEHLNDFYTNKQVQFHVNEGVRIFSLSGEELTINKLSSGEKQLLLLLSNALSARNEASVFIIDEPEISLNVKWQRQLIQALLDCMRGSSAQFLFATHSVEIISQYRGNLVRLVTPDDSHAERT
jgi:ABC-type multidrug transport system ATPase subunit